MRARNLDHNSFWSMGTTCWLESVVALGASGRGVDTLLLVAATPASGGAPFVAALGINASLLLEVVAFGASVCDGVAVLLVAPVAWPEIVVALNAAASGVVPVLLDGEPPTPCVPASSSFAPLLLFDGAPPTPCAAASSSFMDSASGSVAGSLTIESGVGFERFPKGVPSGDTTDSPEVQAPR
jgi:hypothetical protein